MEEEKVGSFIQDANGGLMPNREDEAMAERHSLKKPSAQEPKKKKEVIIDETK